MQSVFVVSAAYRSLSRKPLEQHLSQQQFRVIPSSSPDQALKNSADRFCHTQVGDSVSGCAATGILTSTWEQTVRMEARDFLLPKWHSTFSSGAPSSDLERYRSTDKCLKSRCSTPDPRQTQISYAAL